MLKGTGIISFGPHLPKHMAITDVNHHMVLRLKAPRSVDRQYCDRTILTRSRLAMVRNLSSRGSDMRPKVLQVIRSLMKPTRCHRSRKNVSGRWEGGYISIISTLISGFCWLSNLISRKLLMTHQAASALSRTSASNFDVANRSLGDGRACQFLSIEQSVCHLLRD